MRNKDKATAFIFALKERLFLKADPEETGQIINVLQNLLDHTHGCGKSEAEFERYMLESVRRVTSETTTNTEPSRNCAGDLSNIFKK